MSVERFEWYYMGASGEIGPLSESQLLDLVDHAAIKGETLVWKIGMEAWKTADSIPKIASRIQPAWSPPPAPGPKPPPVQVAPPQIKHSCPKDGTKLDRSNRSGVEIEFCPACRGVWLDRGELEKLIERESEHDRRRRNDDDDDYDRHSRRGKMRDIFDLFD